MSVTARPKTQKVEEYVVGKIVSGRWRPGERIPRDSELCNRLSVSHATISKVMGNLVSQGLLERKQRSGTYVADHVGAKRVAILTCSENLSSPAGYFYEQLLHQCEAHITGSGYKSLPTITRGHLDVDIRSSVRFLDTPVSREMIGLLFFATDLGSLRGECKSRAIPTVGISSALPYDDVPSVVLDYRFMIQHGLKLLNDEGYDDYVVMQVRRPNVGLDGGTDLARLIYDSGVDHEQMEWLPWPGYDYRGVYESFKAFLTRPNRPRAIFFLEDAVCDIALRVISELRIRVPEELAIITHANSGRHFHFPVPMTCLEFDAAEAVGVAWYMLEKLMEKEPLAHPVVHVKPTLKQGESLC